MAHVRGSVETLSLLLDLRETSQLTWYTCAYARTICKQSPVSAAGGKLLYQFKAGIVNGALLPAPEWFGLLAWKGSGVQFGSGSSEARQGRCLADLGKAQGVAEARSTPVTYLVYTVMSVFHRQTSSLVDAMYSRNRRRASVRCPKKLPERHDPRSRTLFSQLGNWMMRLAGKLQVPPNRPFQAKVAGAVITAPLFLRQAPPDSIGRVSSREAVLHGADGFPHPLAACNLLDSGVGSCAHSLQSEV
ncbi:uncharacterized protein THITE_2125290 [Thermothielavioides terrestris NRRL 8126]|uniref:Uncharacterized protein n=1 Tax=Thermothielavioides terrestris (strain ATCC 38088 / NRRL 8126) TaxID=578455 RepID=G2QST6_THETT|nr:uncharacterized protein THITE_2125290 [Thermothielavioides terrestris NRRL 8126]AEO62661.1 hypothetical protein THITE_2125290 [Thermothielavioides terrestris NRRL 8126]